MSEFMQSIPWYVPWLLFALAVMWGTYKSWKLDKCSRERYKYYQQRNGIADEFLRHVFPNERRTWVHKFPPVPRGFKPEYVEEVSDFTPSELQLARHIRERYLDGGVVYLDTCSNRKPTIRIEPFKCAG